MKRRFLLFLTVLLYLLIVACGGQGDQPELKAPTESAIVDDVEEEQEAAIDYCALPGGTQLTWFDLSTYIFIPQSSYQMGFDDQAGEFDHEPAHQVNLGGYWMHETEVTNRQYANCVTAGACAPPDHFADVPYWFEDVQELDDPIVGVTWEQADDYCRWSGARLPTEAEWELAARGVNSDPYPWGTDAPDCELANYLGCLDPDAPEPDFAGLRLKGVSSFEMLDMAGNVNEWVSDWYGEDYYQISPAGSPTGPDTGEMRVWRGGDYQSPAEELLSHLRGALAPNEAQPDLGFRCAWSCGENIPPQLCHMPPMVGQTSLPVGDPPPAVKPQIAGEGYCEWRKDNQATGVILSSPNGADLSQFDFSAPDGLLTCDPLGGNKLVCYGSTVKPDDIEVIIACPDCGGGYYFDKDAGFCKPMITLDPEFVELMAHNDPDSWCPPGEYWISGVCNTLEELEETCISSMKYEYGCGCIWLWETCGEEEPPFCPLGFEWKEGACVPVDGFFGDDMPTHCFPPEILDEPCGCIPFGSVCLGIVEGLEWTGPMIAPPPQLMPEEPLLPGNFGKDPEFNPLPEDCSGDILMRCPPGMVSLLDKNGCQVCSFLPAFQDCPEGYIFDQGMGCCIPEKTVSLCPPGTYYETLSNSCLPVVYDDQSCVEIEVYVPGCGPKPRPTTESSRCTNPNLYRSETACVDSGCKWEIDPASGAGSCTYP